MTVIDQDTIAAIATPPGKGGVGIIRLSGPSARVIGERLTGKTLTVRQAHFCNFYQHASHTPDTLLDQGIAIYFQAPHSFTGEDIVELQGHGGPVILDALLAECLHQGARMARPGEFSQRAFLNDKMDLAQAEAIADLIDSASMTAARHALRSLQGEFSRRIDLLVAEVTELRIFVEAAIDFPEEEVDFLNDGRVREKLERIIKNTNDLLGNANQGRILHEGMTVVIAGKPNAGKSSLMNVLAGYETAIVTDIAGTTRDVLKEQILIDGMPVHVIDTAGLRDSPDRVEQEGIRRAWQAIDKADCILLVTDASQPMDNDFLAEFKLDIQQQKRLTLVRNKCDITGEQAAIAEHNGRVEITLSARQQTGIDLLREHLKQRAGYQQQQEGGFAARRRHIEAIEKALEYLQAGLQQLVEAGAGELLAEDLRYCQQYLGEITGKLSADELLGEIFSSFCIGK